MANRKEPSWKAGGRPSVRPPAQRCTSAKKKPTCLADIEKGKKDAEWDLCDAKGEGDRGEKLGTTGYLTSNVPLTSQISLEQVVRSQGKTAGSSAERRGESSSPHTDEVWPIREKHNG